VIIYNGTLIGSEAFMTIHALNRHCILEQHASYL